MAVCALSAGLTMPFLHAQQASANTDAVVVTAQRVAKAAEETLAQITIINREEIESVGLISLADLLQRRAGVEIRSTGGPGQPSGVFIRGASSTHTLVLVDGLRVGSSSAGSTAFENIPLDLIERIEVVKGARSALYGSDAIGGVIQIFTRADRAKQPVLRADVSTGSYGTAVINAGYTTNINNTSVAIEAGYQRVNAPSATNPGAGSYTYNPDRDAYENTHYSLKLLQRLWQGETVALRLWQSLGKTKFDDGPTGDPSNKQTLTGVSLVSENQLANFWKSHLVIGQTSDDIKTTSSYPSTFKTTQNQYSWQNDLITPAGAASFGIERREEKLSGTTSYSTSKRITNAAFASLEQKVDAQTLAVNARYDHEAQFGNRTTGSATWGYQLWKDELIYLSTATAFHAPSFNDLYYPGYSNPTLKPERSKTIEYGWRVTSKAYRLNLAVFENRIKDLITFDGTTNQPQNTNSARIRGWELGIDTALLGLDWRGRVTVQKPIDTATNFQLRNRAKVYGTLGASKTIGTWDIGIDAVASDARFDSANQAPQSRLVGYALFNTHVRYRPDREWTIELAGNNITNQNYTLVKGYNQLGRQLQLTIRYQTR